MTLTLILIPGLCFAAPRQLEEIKKIEKTQEELGPISLRPTLRYDSSSERDPFRGKKDEGQSFQQSGPDIQPPTLLIQGIVWGGSFPQAIINNRVVKVGDIIDGARIIDIDKNGITIFFEGQQFNIPSPAISEYGPKQKFEGGNNEE